MLRKKFALLFCAILLVPGRTSAQRVSDLAPDTTLTLLAWPSPNEIALRWAPATPRLWHHGNTVGYTVERLTVLPTGEPDPAGFKRLTPVPLKAWPLAEWKARVDRNNTYAGVAVQALYGQSFIPKGTSAVAELRNRADDFMNRFTFCLFAADLSPEVAEGLGLRYVDRDVVSGTEYLYRVFFTTPLTDMEPDTAYVLVKAGPSPEIVPPQQVTLRPGDGSLSLVWPIGKIFNRYTAYWVERSDDGGRSFKRLHTHPLVFLRNKNQPEPVATFIDSSVVNYKRYTYRLYGIIPFGRLSPPAEVIGFARDLTPPKPPRLVEGKHVRESTVRLRWQFDGAPSRDLAGFRIGISNSADGPFELDLDKTLPDTARQALDSRALSNQRNYYVVVALDTAGNASSSMPLYVHLIDSIPPAPPVGLQGEADSTGIVHLRWNLGVEPDLFGYRVYRANQPDHEFTLLTGFPVSDTVFVDTVQVHTLSRAVYYRVRALDRNYNPSPFSEILRVPLPDLIRPVAPVFRRVTATDSSVILEWVPSSSQDVVRQILYRRRADLSDWAVLDTLNAHVGRYEDRFVIQKTTYHYTVQAQDSSGLLSPRALPVQARAYDPGVRPGITGLTAEVDTAKKVIRLRWRYPNAPPGERWFQVYRAVAGEPLMVYENVGDGTIFEDRDVLGWERFKYAVQVRYRDGGRSVLSRPVEVEYRPNKKK